MEEPGRRQRHGDQLIAMTASGSAVTMAATLGLLIALSWLISMGLGGSKSVGPQLFHIPVVLAAGRFGGRGALVASLVVGVVCGPLLPLDVDAGTSQTVGNWIGRAFIFVAVGQITSALHQRSLAPTRERLDLDRNRREVDAAIASGSIAPAYQPIVDLQTGRIDGVEALARWQMGTDARLPAMFIPDAELSGAIVAIDRAILRAACNQLATWIAEGVVDRGFHVSVNLSAANLECDDLLDHVAAVLEASGIEPGGLHLEVTETVLVADPVVAAAQLQELRSLGVKIALDDFGVGQSSLAALARFPVDLYKIDRSFVLGLAGGSKGAALIAGVVGLADILSFEEPVAEGIETAEQLHELVAHGCRRGQGYLFARPQSAADLALLLSARSMTLPGQQRPGFAAGQNSS